MSQHPLILKGLQVWPAKLNRKIRLNEDLLGVGWSPWNLTFQFLETPQHCRPRAQLHSPAVLTDQHPGYSVFVRVIQRGKRGLGVRWVASVCSRGGLLVQDGGAIDKNQQLWNVVHFLVLEEEDSADTKIELLDTSIGFLGKKKHLTPLKSVTIHVISVPWKSGRSLLPPLLVSVYITPHQLGAS